jgi:DNA (cytosine-5)-methyltransferase 1
LADCFTSSILAIAFGTGALVLRIEPLCGVSTKGFDHLSRGARLMRYLSVCSGIEAATVAWHPLGWTPAAFSEIETFPRAVLAHHYPDVPCHGDFTTIGADEYGPIDLLVGGTPCQSFSIAGLRGGMADERGNLALEYLRLADRTRPRWLVWENVPGVLSSDGGRDFGAFLGGMAELGYGFSYRVLDAQFFGLAQRRKRVFVVGHLGNWRSPAAVLFERHSLSGYSPPSRETGQESAARTGFGVAGSVSGGYGAKLGTDESCQGSVIPWPAEICPTLDTYYGDKCGLEDQHVFNQRGGKFVPLSFGWQNSASQGDSVSPHITPTLDKSKTPAVLAINENQQGAVWESETAQALNKGGGKPGQGYAAIRQASTVRRLTPRECERLQGFPDDYTLVPYRGKPAADGPRYKALGNSMAVPVMRWIGERIAAVEALELRLAA